MKPNAMLAEHKLLNDLAAFGQNANAIFEMTIYDYHVYDSTERSMDNPFPHNTLQNLLYSKCWIDAVQWHVEDKIRDPEIISAVALTLKRRIDQLNQQRTDTVELIDDFFL